MTYDFSPLYHFTVGFDRVFDMLDRASRFDPMTSWPPYNIEKSGEDQYRITMAVAGFSPDEIEVTHQDNNLVVVGRKQGEPEQVEVLHRGIATRAFKQNFKLADFVTVEGASLENGMLTMALKREIPEQLRPRQIPIQSGNHAIAGGTVKQLEHKAA